MKASNLLVSIVAAANAALAVDVQKNVIISYDNNVPENIFQEAMNEIRKAGGIITHEYKLIRAFAATCPEKVLTKVQAWGSEYNALIEEDEIVTINTGNN